MSLYKRILFSVLFILTALYSVVFSIQYYSVRGYLSEQQINTVNNTANSLALVIPIQYEKNSNVGIETAIFAAFDSGYYKKISFQAFKDKRVFQREIETSLTQVPKWFETYLGFQPIEEKFVISSGWLQIGELTIISNTGMAMQQLWYSTMNLSLWFLAAFLTTALVINRVLKFILKPLAHLTVYAEFLGENKFDATVIEPRVSELSTLSRAMQKMAEKLKHEYENQQQEAYELRKRVLQDKVSGLGNREYLYAQIESYLQENTSCSIFMIACDSINEIYQKYGFGARDKMVYQISRELSHQVDAIEQVVLARISNTEFIFFLPQMALSDAEDLVKKCHSSIIKQFVPYHKLSDINVYSGSVVTDGVGSVKQLLSMVDNAVQSAKNSECGFSVQHQNNDALGKMDWLYVIRKAISLKNYKFRVMPAIANDDKTVLHQEFLLSICVDGKSYQAGEFVHFIEQQKLCAEFDKSVIEYLLDNNSCENNVAVNIMAGTFYDDSLCQWLDVNLQYNKNKFINVFFEIPESAFVYYEEQVSKFVCLLERYGLNWGVDNFGRHFKSLDAVISYKPSYVKLDYFYGSMLSDSSAGIELVKGVIKSAKNFDIDVIATRVENHQQRVKFLELGVDGYQGYVTGVSHVVTEYIG